MEACGQYRPMASEVTGQPAPLTLPECDLRDFTYMPLDVVRLRDSDVASIDPEAFRAAVLSWCASWHQLPAGSLPDDDGALCRLLGYGRDLKTWRRIRSNGALHGFIKCSDGRLYHPVVAEKAREAWTLKIARRDRTEAARVAKLAQKAGVSVEEYQRRLSQTKTSSVTQSVTETTTEPVTGSKEGNGEERIGLELKKDSPMRRVADDPDFERFWVLYPRKVGKDAARKEWARALKRAPAEQIIVGLKRYQFSLETQYQPHASTWLSEGRWKIEKDTPPPSLLDEMGRERYVPTPMPGGL